MQERPILFSTQMVQAILSKNKTQTRRVIKDGRCPYGEVGDRLWVRETWRPYSWSTNFDWMMVEFKAGGGTKEVDTEEAWKNIHHAWEKLAQECIKADCPQSNSGDFVLQGADGKFPIKWRPSIFMPRAASRILLEVVSIKAEKLQDISPDDIQREGIQILEGDRVCAPIENKITEAMYLDQWIKLWYSINGEKHPWGSNPFVWVVEFRRCY